MGTIQLGSKIIKLPLPVWYLKSDLLREFQIGGDHRLPGVLFTYEVPTDRDLDPRPWWSPLRFGAKLLRGGER